MVQEYVHAGEPDQLQKTVYVDLNKTSYLEKQGHHKKAVNTDPPKCNS